MEDLIRRIEKAAGPDRELDVEIALAIGWRLDQSEPRDRWWEPDRSHYLDEPPEFTASMDAAMTLLKDEWIRLAFGAANGCVVAHLDYPNGPMVDLYSGVGSSAALALCAAALKARKHDR